MAIPINDAIAISKQIDSGIGSANVHVGPTGVLGVLIQEPTAQAGHGRLSSRYGSTVPGVVVAGLTPCSPSEQSGLVRVAWADQSGQQQNAAVRLAAGPPS